MAKEKVRKSLIISIGRPVFEGKFGTVFAI